MRTGKAGRSRHVENLALVAEYQAGDDRALSRLLKANRGLVVHYTQRWLPYMRNTEPSATWADAESLVTTAAWHAARLYDATRCPRWVPVLHIRVLKEFTEHRRLAWRERGKATRYGLVQVALQAVDRDLSSALPGPLDAMVRREDIADYNVSTRGRAQAMLDALPHREGAKLRVRFGIPVDDDRPLRFSD